MGIYLNSSSAFGLFRRDCLSTYFIDKSSILKELVPLVESDDYDPEKTVLNSQNSQKYVAITRPRRFGKTVMANMIASYFGRGIDSSKIFDRLAVSQYPWYQKHLNQHNVIHIMFNEIPAEITDYNHYINRNKKNDCFWIWQKAFTQMLRLEKEDSVWDALTSNLRIL